MLTSISALEESLKEIDSARTQVQNTVKAYSAVEKQINNYSKALQDIAKSIASIISDIKDKRQILAEDISSAELVLKNKIDEIISRQNEALTTSVSVLKNDLNSINASFSENCNNITASFSTATETGIERIKLNIKSIEQTATQIIETSRNNVENILSTCSNIIEKNSTKIISSICETQDLAKKIFLEHENKLLSLIDKINKDLIDLRDSSQNLNQTANSIHNELKASIELTSKQLRNSIEDTSRKILDLENSSLNTLSSLKKENTQMKTVIIINIIFTIITTALLIYHIF